MPSSPPAKQPNTYTHEQLAALPKSDRELIAKAQAKRERKLLRNAKVEK